MQLVKFFVDTSEIDHALNQIADDKSPGIDGWNAVFFKQAWPVIKLDIYDAVKHFFNTGYMSSQARLIVLPLHYIGAKDSTSFFGQGLETHCMLYNALQDHFQTARLQTVISDIVDIAQSGPWKDD